MYFQIKKNRKNSSKFIQTRIQFRFPNNSNRGFAMVAKKTKWDENENTVLGRKGGFTLIEFLVAIAISSIVMVLIVNMYIRLNKSYMAEKVVADTQQALRQTMERMMLDIRNAGFDPKRSADAGLEVATSTRLRFTQDIFYETASNDYSGAIDDGRGERITYQIDAANNRLLKIFDEGTTSQTSNIILTNINPAQSSFSFLDASGATTATLNDIRSAIITLALQNNAGWGDSVSRALTTQVTFRNISLN
ncbi:hypothetical protein DESC_120045 [Desulfosarcina cetonica]|nr:hypothetical protein DESC_120045 [Desulfosarcina cetonica]